MLYCDKIRISLGIHHQYHSKQILKYSYTTGSNISFKNMYVHRCHLYKTLSVNINKNSNYKMYIHLAKINSSKSLEVQAVAAHTFNPSKDRQISVRSRPAQSTKWVRGQPGWLQRERLSQKQMNQKIKKERKKKKIWYTWNSLGRRCSSNTEF